METKTFWPRPQCAGGIWKRRFHSENASNVFRTHYAGGIWKRNRSFWICVWEKLGQGKSHDDRDASFSKSPVFKMFTVHTKTFSNSLRFEERSRKAPLSWRISVDGRPNCEIKLRFQILLPRMDAVLNSFHVIKQEWIYKNWTWLLYASWRSQFLRLAQFACIFILRVSDWLQFLLHVCNSGRQWLFFCPNKVLLEPRHVIAG